MTVKKILLVLSLALVPLAGYSQMFSVYNQPERISTNKTSFRIGTSLTDFTFQGSDPEDVAVELLEVSSPILVVGVESSGLQVNALVGNRFTGIKDGSFFDLNLRFTNSVRIVRNQKFVFGIPIQLATGITTSNSDFEQERFSQTIFSAGTGASLEYNFKRKINLTASGIAGYGFSNSNGGFFGGSLFYSNAKARLNFLNIFGDKGISLGYDYSFKSFDIEAERFDFDLSAHLLTIGFIL